MPKVSVIMACHDSSKFVGEAIGSVLCQTLHDLELILVDDCSTDNTLAIAKGYQARDDRITIISLPKNQGPAIARNVGIDAAKGEWLGILDSDDVAMPERLEEQMRLADNRKDIVLIAGGSISTNEKGQKIKEHEYPTDHKALVKRLYTKQAFPHHSSMVYRREVVEKLGGFNSRYIGSEDYDLWVRLSEVGKVAAIDKPLVKFRSHEQNISKSEGGERNRRFGFIAVTCHFLRTCNHPDPSISSKEQTWQRFVLWIDDRIKEEGVFDRRLAWVDARKNYFSSSNQLSGALRFGTRLLLSGHAVSLIWEKIFGSSLPRRLAREWMKLT